MNNILKIFLTAALALTLHGSYGQLSTGGTMNFSFDNGSCIDFAPEIGYRIDKLRVGFAPFVLYKEITDVDNVTFGARIFAEYDIIKDVYVHVESQVTRVQSITALATGDIKSTKWVISFPIGAGYRYKIADKTYAWGSILYDFFLDENSPQKNPLVRGGVTYEF